MKTCIAALLLSVVLLNDTVRAQWESSLERPWVSQFTDREMALMSDLLQFDEVQKTILSQMVKDHADSVAAIASEGQAFERDSDPFKDNAQHPESETEEAQIRRRRKLAEFADRLSNLDIQFTDQIMLIFTPEQDPLWNLYLRDRRWRRLEVFSTFVPGAKVNLNGIATALNLDPITTERLEPILYEYDYVMDGMLDQMFQSAIQAARRNWRQLERVHNMNEEQRKALVHHSATEYDAIGRRHSNSMIHEWQRELAPQLAVRQTNVIYSDQIASKLPPAIVDEFRRQVRHAAHPEIFDTTTKAHLLVSKVLKLQSLRDDQRVSIAALWHQVEESLEKLNEEGAQVEESNFVKIMTHPTDFDLRRSIQDGVKAFQRKRDKAVEDAAKDILAFLDDAQRRVVDRKESAKESSTPSSRPTTLPR